MKRTDFLKGALGLVLAPLAIAGEKEVKEKVVEKVVERVVEKVVSRTSLIPQARYRYKNWIVRYLESRPNDDGEWMHRFTAVERKYQYSKKDAIDIDGITIKLSEDDLRDLIFLERMYPPKTELSSYATT